MELVRIDEGLYIPSDFKTYHAYYADPEGKHQYTGITSVLGVIAKPALIQWSANEAIKYIQANSENNDGMWYVRDEVLDEARKAHTHKKEDAASHGTLTHSLVERYINECMDINGGAPLSLEKFTEKDKHEFAPIAKFIEWACLSVRRFNFSEKAMASTVHHIAGTSDFGFVGKDGHMYIGDFKTSSGVYGVDYFLQVAAYGLLAEENKLGAYTAGVIFRIGRDGKSDVHYRYEEAHKQDREYFLNALALYRAQATYKKQ